MNIEEIVHDLEYMKKYGEFFAYQHQALDEAIALIKALKLISEKQDVDQSCLNPKCNAQKPDDTQVETKAQYAVLRVDNHGADTAAKKTMRAAARLAVGKYAFEIEPVAPQLAYDLHCHIKAHELADSNIACIISDSDTTLKDLWTANDLCKDISCVGCPFEHTGGISCSPEARKIAQHWYYKGIKDGSKDSELGSVVTKSFEQPAVKPDIGVMNGAMGETK